KLPLPPFLLLPRRRRLQRRRRLLPRRWLPRAWLPRGQRPTRRPDHHLDLRRWPPPQFHEQRGSRSFPFLLEPFRAPPLGRPPPRANSAALRKSGEERQPRPNQQRADSTPGAESELRSRWGRYQIPARLSGQRMERLRLWRGILRETRREEESFPPRDRLAKGRNCAGLPGGDCHGRVAGRDCRSRGIRSAAKHISTVEDSARLDRPAGGRRRPDDARPGVQSVRGRDRPGHNSGPGGRSPGDRKSTRLNSSHSQISYAVFCLKKKKK